MSGFSSSVEALPNMHFGDEGGANPRVARSEGEEFRKNANMHNLEKMNFEG